MIAVIQRVKRGAIFVDSKEIASINSGIAVFLGVETGDNEKDLLLMTKKINGIRIFEDESERMMKPLSENQQILVISQFTLLGSLSRGFRPDFTKAEKPDLANQWIDRFIKILREDYHRRVQTGQFGSDMEVNLSIDGPVTILFDTRS
jgi:D-tyrosyl-tRNA(Tyr) deacylase